MKENYSPGFCRGFFYDSNKTEAGSGNYPPGSHEKTVTGK
jgi:hypothetical protein